MFEKQEGIPHFIKLRMSLPCTIYPTLSVRTPEWLEAKKLVLAGGTAVIVGISGGYGCRGSSLPSKEECLEVFEFVHSPHGDFWKARYKEGSSLLWDIVLHDEYEHYRNEDGSVSYNGNYPIRRKRFAGESDEDWAKENSRANPVGSEE